MSIKLQLPKLTDLRPRLTVIGVGGAGCNAINNMIAAGLSGVEFIVANTDAQALAASSAEHRVQLGINLTEGLGAGAKPEIGEAAAEEAIEEIRSQVAGSHMVFIAAGMGGGTGTGAAAVIARAARDLGILVVGVVTKPFQFEGARRLRIAETGIGELKKYVDTLIVIPNQNLFRIASDKTTFAEAFVLADQVLYSGVACIVDLIIKEGLINLDFADVRTIMSGMGTAMMGTGEAIGERRAIMAAEEAISNPLLDDVSLKGAKGLLLSITGGPNLTLYEVDEAASRVRQEVDPEANIIVGATFDDTLGERVRVSIVASGMARSGEQVRQPNLADAWPRTNKKVPAPGAPFDPAAMKPAASPAPSAPPAPAAGRGDEDIQRRLSEAIQAQAPEENYGAEYTYAPQTEPAPHAQPPSNTKTKETWRAPGGVTIEEGLPPLRSNAPQREAHRPDRQSEFAPRGVPPAAFAPAQPADIPRSQRRAPQVEDFPAIGQREYRAKSGQPQPQSQAESHRPAETAAAFEQIEPRRRVGFIERLTGRRRRESDSGYSEQQFGAAPELQQAPNYASDHMGPPPADAHGRKPRQGANPQEMAELPVFFARERKS